MAHYLTAENYNPSISDKKHAFMVRTNMALTAANFPNRFNGRKCQLNCSDDDETYEHIMSNCTALEIGDNLNQSQINEIFGNDTENINKYTKAVMQTIDKRLDIIMNKADEYTNK